VTEKLPWPEKVYDREGGEWLLGEDGLYRWEQSIPLDLADLHQEWGPLFSTPPINAIHYENFGFAP
jgi:hypothetical protein